MESPFEIFIKNFQGFVNGFMGAQAQRLSDFLELGKPLDLIEQAFPGTQDGVIILDVFNRDGDLIGGNFYKLQFTWQKRGFLFFVKHLERPHDIFANKHRSRNGCIEPFVSID